MSFIRTLVALCATCLSLVNAQSSCATPIAPSGGIRPSLASGYAAQVVASGLGAPRGIKFDNAGNLLVIEQSSGDLTALTLHYNDGCVSVASSTTVASGHSVNISVTEPNYAEVVSS